MATTLERLDALEASVAMLQTLVNQALTGSFQGPPGPPGPPVPLDILNDLRERIESLEAKSDGGSSTDSGV